MSAGVNQKRLENQLASDFNSWMLNSFIFYNF